MLRGEVAGDKDGVSGQPVAGILCGHCLYAGWVVFVSTLPLHVFFTTTFQEEPVHPPPHSQVLSSISLQAVRACGLFLLKFRDVC